MLLYYIEDEIKIITTHHKIRISLIKNNLYVLITQFSSKKTIHSKKYMIFLIGFIQKINFYEVLLDE